MIERRKISDRRVNAPKQGLPLYYTRHITDRRQKAACMQRSPSQRVMAYAQPDA